MDSAAFDGKESRSRSADFVPLARPEIQQSGLDAALAVLQSGWLGYGPVCRNLEQAFVGERGGWALATQSCTSVLWAIATVAKRGPSPEVIMPANTYVACASAFLIAGWKVCIADVDPRNGLLCLEDAARHVSKDTAAVLVVDTYGQRYPEAAARAFANRHELLLIRDAAHRVDIGEATPTADFVCYSFGPTKELASPEGGLIWSRAEELEEPVRAVTYWGIQQDTWQRTHAAVHAAVRFGRLGAPGLKLRMTDVNGAIVLAQLRSLKAQRSARQSLALSYKQALSCKAVQWVERDEDDACLMLPILIDPARRDALRVALAERGVATSDHYPNLERLLPDVLPQCRNAEAFCASVIALPMHLRLTPQDIERIAAAF